MKRIWIGVLTAIKICKGFNEEQKSMKQLSKVLGSTSDVAIDRVNIMQKLNLWRRGTYSYWVNGNKITKTI